MIITNTFVKTRAVISYERENNPMNDITKVDILTTEKLKKRSKKERKSTHKVPIF